MIQQAAVQHYQLQVNNPMEQHKWEDFPFLHPAIIATLTQKGMAHPTAIQAEVFQNYKHYYDFLIASQTGSGKTLAFAAPIISDILTLAKKAPIPKKVICLVMAPTRELAQQIEGVFGLLIKDTELRQVSIVGGLSAAKQLRMMRQRGPQIVIGTPGRIQEMLEQGEIDFEFLRFLVVDEADRMIEMGHYMELDKILGKIFSPKIKEIYEGDFNEINKKMAEGTNNQFYVRENGKKRKITFNLNSVATDQLFEIPMDLFKIQGEVDLKPVEAPKPKRKRHAEAQKVVDQEVIQKQKEFIGKLKRRIFFISATLTRDFKGIKYFIKKDKAAIEAEKKERRLLRKQREESKAKGGKGGKGDKKGEKGDKFVKGKEESSEDYIPKLKALLSRVKFDAKPKIIDLSSQIFLPAKLKERFCFCQDDIEKIAIILCYIKELPQGAKCILFTNTIRASKRVKFFMDAAGLKSVSLHSHMMQKQRLEKLEKFQKSKINILISTDVAARGLDFEISNVIQYSVPINGDTYVHRVGRTARANRSGEALVLITQKEASKWQEIGNIISSSDPNRKADKYCPLQSEMDSMLERVKEFEWVRLNEEQLENKRQGKVNEMDAQELGVEMEDEEVVKKVNQMSKEDERMRKQMIQRQIKMIKQRDREKPAEKKQAEVGDGKTWRKNKLVMSIDEIKKFL